MNRRVVVIALFFVAGCGSSPSSEIESLDRRFVWPCERLIVDWRVDATALYEVFGPTPVLKQQNDAGFLRLNVRHCTPESGSTAKPFAFAYLTAQLDADDLPVYISGMSDESWWTIDEFLTTGNARKAFAELQYPVATAEISFESTSAKTGTQVQARLVFPEGEISLLADAVGRVLDFSESTALLHQGETALLAFFGEETGARRNLSAIDVAVQGRTPLSAFDLSATKASGRLDEGVNLKPIHWRLPAH